MPRIPLTAPTLAWTRQSLPVFPPERTGAPLVGYGKVVCYRFIEMRMPGEGAQEIWALDLEHGKPLFALSRLQDEDTVPSRAAFDAEGRVVLMEIVPAWRGLQTVLDDKGVVQLQRPFAEAGILSQETGIEQAQVCSGVAVAGVSNGRVFGVPLEAGQPVWSASESRLAGVAERVVVLIEKVEKVEGSPRLVARSPGGEVIWRGEVISAEPRLVRVGARIILRVDSGGTGDSLVGLDPESGRELFRREMADRIVDAQVTETGLIGVVLPGGVQVLDPEGELIGAGSGAFGPVSLLAVDGNRLLLGDINGNREHRVTAWQVEGTPSPLWSLALPGLAMPPVAFDGGFVVRTKSFGLLLYRSAE